MLGIIVKVGSHVFSSVGHKKVTNPSFVRVNVIVPESVLPPGFRGGF